MSAKDENEDILVKLIETNKTEEVVEFLKSVAGENVKICNSIAKKGESCLDMMVKNASHHNTSMQHAPNVQLTEYRATK